MAKVMFLVLFLKISLICFVQSAPTQVNERIESTSSHVPSIQNVGTVDDFYMVNTTDNNGSKMVASVNNNDDSQNVIYVTQGVVANTVESSEDTKINKVIGTVAVDIRKTDTKSKVMVLTDDVITDALFTNIDTIQDHLEVCEEGLRQKLRHHSHGSLLQDVAVKEADYTTDRGETENYENDNEDSSDVRKDTENNKDDDEDSEKADDDVQDEEDSNDEDDQDEDVPSSKIALASNSKAGKNNIRKRRSLKERIPVGQPLRKVDVLAEKVVSRLSSRLEYLRSSLVQCHLLYRQFESL
uniref:Uncharacterized protein n=1 Tax=Arion vulgaris TaxID=1028688 RepID=A0A0B7AWV6_9EUPU